MIIYTKGRSFSPVPPKIPLNKTTLLNVNGPTITKPLQPMDFRTARPSTSRKSLDHKGYLQESLEKRNKTFTNLEKTIQDVLDQNKKTKQILKEFLTPYRQKNKSFRDLQEKSNKNCVIDHNNLKEYSFNNDFHEEDNRETPKGFCEGNHVNEGFSNNHEVKQEKEEVFNTPIKENAKIEEKNENNHIFNGYDMGEKQKEFEEFMGKLEDLQEGPFSKNENIQNYREILRNKFRLFDIVKYKCPQINKSNDKIEEKIQFIQSKTKVNIRRFIEELYDDLNNFKVSIKIY